MKKKKVVCKLLIIIFMLFIFSVDIYATDSIIQGADDFLKDGNREILNTDAIKTVSDTIYNVFVSIGSIVVIIVGAILGIKFMIGSVEEKAEIKESIKPYAWGAIIIFAAVTIWNIIVQILQDVF